mmetsp:Transcript_9526/g.24218  ORF Transcript_9526/g.24218 Transcript_9526/m.24218 type:complete len:368 (+) Transcript_9526:601-1704(+)
MRCTGAATACTMCPALPCARARPSPEALRPARLLGHARRLLRDGSERAQDVQPGGAHLRRQLGLLGPRQPLERPQQVAVQDAAVREGWAVVLAAAQVARDVQEAPPEGPWVEAAGVLHLALHHAVDARQQLEAAVAERQERVDGAVQCAHQRGAPVGRAGQLEAAHVPHVCAHVERGLRHQPLAHPGLGVVLVVLEEVQPLPRVAAQQAQLLAVRHKLRGGDVALVVVLGHEQQLPVLLALRVGHLPLPRLLHVADKRHALVNVPQQDEVLDDVDGRDEQRRVEEGGLRQALAVPVVQQQLGAHRHQQALLHGLDGGDGAAELARVQHFVVREGALLDVVLHTEHEDSPQARIVLAQGDGGPNHEEA